MNDLFRKEVIENLRHRLEGDVYLILPPSFKFLLVFVLAAAFVSIVFLSLGEYKKKERVLGVIEPSLGVVKLQSTQSGVVSNVLVHEGEFVDKGTPIMRIASAMYTEGQQELNQSLLEKYLLQKSKLNKQISDQIISDEIEFENLERRSSRTRERLLALEKNKDLYLERLILNEKLLANISQLKSTGYISELELQKTKDSYLQLRQQVTNVEFERLAILAQVEELNSQMLQLPFTQEQRLNLVNEKQSELSGKIASIQQQKEAEIRAPKSGVITNILAKQGMNVAAHKPLATLLPEGAILNAILYIPSSAYGFVKLGQEVNLRYHAFPYEKFGVFSGKIILLSDSPTLPEESNMPSLLQSPAYRVVVDLESQSVSAYGERVQIKTGMLLDADIIIEERSLIRWLFDPIFSIKERL